MPLSSALNNTLLTHRCPHCGHRTEKTGDWFKIVGRYQCKSCLRPVSLTYEDKVQLFEDHGHLAVPYPRSVTSHGKAIGSASCCVLPVCSSRLSLPTTPSCLTAVLPGVPAFLAVGLGDDERAVS